MKILQISEVKYRNIRYELTDERSKEKGKESEEKQKKPESLQQTK